MIFKNKKGSSQILLAYDLIIALIMIVLFIAIAKRAATAGAINEEFIAKDSALMTDALHNLPGDVSISYDAGNSTNSFSLYIFNGNAKLTGILGLVHSYPYRQGEGISIAENEMDVQKGKINIFTFEKQGSLISIKGAETEKNE